MSREGLQNRRADFYECQAAASQCGGDRVECYRTRRELTRIKEHADIPDAARQDDVQSRIGRRVRLERQRPSVVGREPEGANGKLEKRLVPGPACRSIPSTLAIRVGRDHQGQRKAGRQGRCRCSLVEPDLDQDDGHAGSSGARGSSSMGVPRLPAVGRDPRRETVRRRLEQGCVEDQRRPTGRGRALPSVACR